MDFWPLDYNLDNAAPAVAAGALDDAVLRALVRSVPVVRGRLQAARGPQYRHGAPERGVLRQLVPERLSQARRFGHRTRAQVGLHHRARERARMVRQQHHGEGQRRHVGARELRELRRRASTRNASSARRRARSTSSATGAASGTTGRSFPPTTSTIRARATCTRRAARCCTPSARSSTTTRSGAASSRGLNTTFWHQTVMGQADRGYISTQAGIDLRKVFDQYLRTTMIPTFEYRIDGRHAVVSLDQRRARASTCRSR